MPIRWLRSVWPKHDREDVAAYLTDLHRRERMRRGALIAGLWLWGQCCSLLIRLVWTGRGRRRVVTRKRATGAAGRLASDALAAARSLRRSPSFALLACTTLSLGFATTVTVFAVVDALMWRPLPYAESDRLVWPWPGGGGLTHERYDLLVERVAPFGTMTAFANRQFALLSGDTPAEVDAMAVSPNHFDLFGVPPVLGRGFVPSDAEPGAPPVVILGHELWQSQFGADSAVVGREVALYRAAAIPMVAGAFSGTSPTVVGVASPGYAPFGSRVSVWTPLPRDPASSNYSQMGELSVITRMRTDMTVADFGTAFTAAARQVEGLEHMFSTPAEPVPVASLQYALAGNVRTPMQLAFSAVLLVLLISCVNVANLFLARNTERQRETAVRVALGASRVRIVAQMGCEALLLTGVAAAVGWLLSLVFIPMVAGMLPTNAPSVSITPDARVLGFVGLCVLASAFAAGVVPAFGVDMNGAAALARGGDRGAQRSHRLTQALVAVEVGVALAVAVTAALLAESFRRVHAVDGGFARNVLTLRVAPAAPIYRDVVVRRRLFAQVLDGVRALPGVEAAGAIHFLPVADAGTSLFFLPSAGAERQVTHYRVITPDYLDAMGIPLLSGRDLTDGDRADAAPVGLVNRSFAQDHGSGNSAVGQTVYRTNGNVWFTIVGVVGDVRQFDLAQAPQAEAYLPLAQSQWANAMSLVVRSDNPAVLAEPVRQIVRSLDPDLPVMRMATMEEVVAWSVADRRFYAVAFAVFAALSVVLGAVGAYSVARFWMGRRTRELGVRLALGGSKARVTLGEVLRGSRTVLIGLAGGLVAALAAGRMLDAVLFGVAPSDPRVLTAATALLLSVALVATYLPVRRAVRVDPMQTLRQE